MSKTFIHPTAIVDHGAVIGEGSKIWHFTHIMPTAVIGKHCSLGQNCVVMDRVKLGDGCKVQNNVSIYEGVTVEDEVFLGPSMVFTNILVPRSHIVRKGQYEKTLVKYRASIGANATIVCGNTIGSYALIGAGAVVVRDVPDHAIIVGNPGRRIGWACQCGLTLLPASSACECGARYRLEETGPLFSK